MFETAFTIKSAAFFHERQGVRCVKKARDVIAYPGFFIWASLGVIYFYETPPAYVFIRENRMLGQIALVFY